MKFPERFLLPIIVIICISNVAIGQGIFTSGESMIKIEPSMNQIEAEDKALEMAKIDALIKKFGQYIEQQSDLDLDSGKVSFRSFGQTKVKGEWIRTIGDPDFVNIDKTLNGKTERWISCKVRGEVRKAIPKADLSVKILSCPSKECVSEKFKTDQDIFLYIKSPIEGYLTVFLDDGINAYRLLPYRSVANQKSVFISADKDYIFFSKDLTSQGEGATDAIKAQTDRDVEINTFVVIFSEKEFSKPRLDDEEVDKNGYITPRFLTKKYFENWLGENRAAFPDFLDLKKRIIIYNN